MTSDSSYHNYGHFLLDAVPRLHLFEKAGLSLDDVDYIYCPLPTRSARRILERLGIPMERIIEPARRVAIKPETLLATSFPGTRRNYQPWLVAFLRERLTPDAVTPHRRLYVRRTEFRRLVNEDELLPLLEAEGFETYNPVDHADPPRDFAEASVVVGVHGANLADVVFCRPGARVLEIVPLDHQEPYYYAAADAAGLRYGYLVGDAAIPTPRSPNQSDVHVSLSDFKAALADTLASP
jgi:capsular polysaccharide biosynthesis protein